MEIEKQSPKKLEAKTPISNEERNDEETFKTPELRKKGKSFNCIHEPPKYKDKYFKKISNRINKQT